MPTTKRYIARLVIEAASAFAVNSGRKTLTSDNEIVLDAFGFPYIPGTSITGVLRHAYAEAYGVPAMRKLFGASTIDFSEKDFPEQLNDDTETRKEKIGKLKKSYSTGSAVIFSSAHLVAHDGKTVLDGLDGFTWYNNQHAKNDYYANLLNFPRRDHVRISDRGATDPQSHGKFERTLVCKGARFCFEMELVDFDGAAEQWEQLKVLLKSEYFRLGAGTRKGSGRFALVEEWCSERVYDLRVVNDLEAYLAKSSQLSRTTLGNSFTINYAASLEQKWEDHSFSISPQSFFLFGTGLPGWDSDADNTPKIERVLVWTKTGPEFRKKYLIPATSIKGAISHRLSFHYNQIKKRHIRFCSTPSNIVEAYFQQIKAELTSDLSGKPDVELDADILEQSPTWRAIQKKDSPSLPTVGEENPAVAHFFGTAKADGSGRNGHVVIEDTYIDREEDEHGEPIHRALVYHTKIDRLTGGAYPSALFREEVLSDSGTTISIEVKVESKMLEGEENSVFKLAWDRVIEEVKNGKLPLGGATTKGYGLFEGKS